MKFLSTSSLEREKN